MIRKKNIIEILQKVDIFSRFDKKTLILFAKCMKSIHLKKDETLFEKGDDGSTMYIIANGSVKVHANDYIFTTLNNKQYFGEYSLIDSTIRSASVTAIKDTELLELLQKDFNKIANKRKNVWHSILVALIKRLRKNNTFETELVNRNAIAKKEKTNIEKDRLEIEEAKKEISLEKKELENINLTKDKLFLIIADSLKKSFKNTGKISQDLNKNFNNLNKIEQKQAVDIICSFFKNTNDILDKTLAWSKLQFKNVFVEFSTNDLLNIIDKINGFNKHAMSQKNINFNTSLKDPVYGFFDKGMIMLVFEYLTISTIDYLEYESEVNIDVKEKQDMLEIAILYSNIKISADKLNLFFKIEEKEKISLSYIEDNNFELGLIVCKEFLKKNGGSIWAEDVDNKNTIIKFTLPKAL